jgi:hypothetical protein
MFHLMPHKSASSTDVLKQQTNDRRDGNQDQKQQRTAK